MVTEESMKTTDFWDTAPSSLVGVPDVSEVCTASIIMAMNHLSTHLWNVGLLQRDCTAFSLRSLSSPIQIQLQPSLTVNILDVVGFHGNVDTLWIDIADQ
jgi:hypothetical protein